MISIWTRKHATRQSATVLVRADMKWKHCHMWCLLFTLHLHCGWLCVWPDLFSHCAAFEARVTLTQSMRKVVEAFNHSQTQTQCTQRNSHGHKRSAVWHQRDRGMEQSRCLIEPSYLTMCVSHHHMIAKAGVKSSREENKQRFIYGKPRKVQCEVREEEACSFDTEGWYQWMSQPAARHWANMKDNRTAQQAFWGQIMV